MRKFLFGPCPFGPFPFRPFVPLVPFVFLFACGGEGCDLAASDAGAQLPDPSTCENNLECLGLLPADTPPPGVPAGAHPLNDDVPLTLLGTRELFVGGAVVAETLEASFVRAGAPLLGFEFFAHAWESAGAPAAAPLAVAVRQEAIAAQLDNDAPQETVVVSILIADLQLQVYDPSADGGWETTLLNGVIPVRDDGQPFAATDIDVAAADLDRDGRDELVVAVAGSTGFLLVLAHDGDAWQILSRREYPGAKFLKVAVGNLDGDFEPEIAVAHTPIDRNDPATPNVGVTITSVSEDLMPRQSPVTVQGESGGAPFDFDMIDIEIDDLNGDGGNVLIIAGQRSALQTIDYGVLLALPSGEGVAILGRASERVTRHFGANPNLNVLAETRLATTTPSPSLPGFVAVNNVIFQFLDDELTPHATIAMEPMWESCEVGGRAPSPIVSARDFVVVAGNFDNTVDEELVFAIAGGCSLVVASPFLGLAMAARDTIATVGKTAQPPFLAAVDLNPDQLTVDFVGRDFVVSEVMVLAMLAAPPCYEGLQTGCTTTLGTSITNTETISNTVSVSAEFFLGFSVTGGVLTQTKASFKASVKVGLANQQTWSTSRTSGSGTTTAHLQEAIIVGYVPYDVYRYQVLAGVGEQYDEMLAQTEAGELPELLVGIPREPRTQSMPISFFNDHVRPVDQMEVPFVHRAGDPSIYRTQAALLTYVDEVLPR